MLMNAAICVHSTIPAGIQAKFLNYEIGQSQPIETTFESIS